MLHGSETGSNFFFYISHFVFNRHKGVKVELGIPYEMWDTPSAGVTEMQRQVCDEQIESALSV